MVKTGDLHYVYVLIYLDCYHKIWQTWELINERNLFLTVLGAGKSQIEAPADSGSGEEAASWVIDGHLFTITSHGCKHFFFFFSLTLHGRRCQRAVWSLLQEH